MRLPLLLYHWFDDGRPTRSPEFGLDPGEFREQMDWIVAEGFNAVSLSAVSRALGGKERLPARPVAITFDDAYQDFLDHALPVLAARRLPATLFAVAGLVGKTNEWDQAQGEPPRRLLDWAGLREVSKAGIEIGSHSLRHPDLRTLDGPALAEELRAARSRLEDGLGEPVPHLAYPFGRFDERVKRCARELGHETASAVLIRPWDWLRSDRYSLMRVIIHAGRGLGSFERRVRLAAPAHREG